MINTQYISKWRRRFPMANVVKKHSISSELAQKMVDEAVAKARDIGISENVAILDDGAISRHLAGWMVPRSFASRLRRIRRIQLCSASPLDLFNFIQADLSLLAGMPTLPRMAAWGGGFPIKVDGEIVGAIGLSGAPTVQNDIDCARAALALVSDAVPVD
jgi:uncharacterized protein GlcG (DUF336 family)